eukprot:CAMPEP_0198430634 /NCGR_PEP_ID=MMETSP1452-20131203/14643_1 /TAXON_ID=1181717 /ORGANISM="Synchroma pusillum, Strain CCMP3072" /LENGTH=363 /DNA_ID=CAMNT_0044151075 /DNA_START=25 /DNA_END=1116 /DNA_ORIENTATION=-
MATLELPSLDFGNLFKPAAAPRLRVGTKKLAVITGASSGLGRATARSLIDRGDHFVVMACRDVEKAERVAAEEGFDKNSYAVMKCDLNSLDNVRQFVRDLKAAKGGRPLDKLVANAAVYLPAQQQPTFTEDGFEESLGVNHLAHFLMIMQLLDEFKGSKDPRVVVVGSITGNTNTVGGGLVWPRADLGTLKGFERASQGEKGVAMVDGKNFNGAKAYKDSKVLNMQTALELHKRYHKQTGITFSTMYPGCIAETALFRTKRQWFRTLFPLFMRYVTGGYVSEQEAGDRLAQCVADARCKESGAYWSWNGAAKTVGYFSVSQGGVVGAGGSGGELFANEPSSAVLDEASSTKMWDLSMKAVGLA